MSDRERKPWQPRIREEPIFNPFERPTDWTRDMGANDRVEVPEEEEEETNEAQSTDQSGGQEASSGSPAR